MGGLEPMRTLQPTGPATIPPPTVGTPLSLRERDGLQARVRFAAGSTAEDAEERRGNQFLVVIPCANRNPKPRKNGDMNHLSCHSCRFGCDGGRHVLRGDFVYPFFLTFFSLSVIPSAGFALLTNFSLFIQGFSFSINRHCRAVLT
jgi:hypothetical protein